ncbi:MAG: hypothetical protein GY822_28015, partial [Deltaproteobacteria bacterium]|nr:hypothetical protein [Deltaproteobacteria bacterium]
GDCGGLEERKGPSSKWLVNFQYTAPVLIGAWVVIWGARGHLSVIDLMGWATVMTGGMLFAKRMVRKRQKMLCIAAERLVRLAEVRFGQNHEVTERARAAWEELQEGAQGDADFHTRMEASLRYTEELLLTSGAPPLG